MLQGSLIGPRLFSIDVNDLPTSVPSAEVHMYVDDTTAFVVGDCVDEVIQKLNKAAFKINNWCSRKMTVHRKKSKAMLITTKKFIGPHINAV